MERGFGFPEQQGKTPERPREYNDFLEHYLKNLELPAQDSEGFLLIPAENVLITPYNPETASGFIEITEPKEKKGIEQFKTRDEFEEDFPVKLLKPSVDKENRIFSATENPEKSFHPNFDMRFCMNLIRIFENTEDAFILMPILPASGQKYEKQLKLPGSNLLRGESFPKSSQILKVAEKKVILNPKKEYPKNEIILSPETFLKTGLWTIQFTNKRGKYSRIPNCHLWRDEETGTLDAFLMKKLFFFQDIDDFNFEDKLSAEINRAHAVVSLNELLRIQEGDPLKLKQLYQGNQRIQDLKELSSDYHGLFTRNEKGEFILNESQFTPTLAAFLNYEKLIINREKTDLDSVESIKSEQILETHKKIGELFEKLMSRILEKEINKNNITYRLKPERDLEKITKDYPADFQAWAQKYINSHNAIVLKPDFILENGDLIEVKRGEAFNAPHNKNQFYRMLLYKILTEKEINIQIISLHQINEAEKIEGLEYLYFFDSAYTNNLSKDEIAEIADWEKKLSKIKD